MKGILMVALALLASAFIPCAMAQEGAVVEEQAEAAEAVSAGVLAGVLAEHAESLSLIVDSLVRILMSPVSSVLKLCFTVPCSLFQMCLTVPCYALQACVSCVSCCPCCSCCSPCFVCCGDICQSVSDAAGGIVPPVMDILTGFVEDAAHRILPLPA